MGPTANRRKRPLEKQESARSVKRKKNEDDLQDLERRVDELKSLEETPKLFSNIPLSQRTSKGLQSSSFKTLTEVQARTLPIALRGLDVLGAAKTGSGKTLAFLVPVLENLYRARWNALDGLGALILSPTRELAIQIYDVLQKVGRYHDFSAGLVVGGKSLDDERKRIGRMNILVCTPGRILQHLDQTADLTVDGLRMLVLDEADRILDMGFAGTVDAILAHLPTERQTLLFSATQTKRLSDLARLSLQEPEYVSVHEKASAATPATLKQHYVVTPLPQKLNTLYSFIRSNLKAKILVFMSSGKQVRFTYETFRRLQPGIPLLHLLGKQKQTARLEITNRFRNASHSCLFATDVVARGLDFPSVDWVLQLDCPEDAETYIHRVGRTARYHKDGRAVLFLNPSEEEGMLRRLEHKKVPIERITVREKKQQSIQNQLQSMCFKDPEVKFLGQKALISYARSIYLQKDKEIFDLSKLPIEEFATSLGLPGAPKIKFMNGADAKAAKNRSRYVPSDSGAESDDERSTAKKQKEVRTKYDRMFERRNQDVLTPHYSNLASNSAFGPTTTGDQSDADSDAEFLTVKRGSQLNDSETLPQSNDPSSNYPSSLPISNGTSIKIDSKRRERLLRSKKALAKLKPSGQKLIFDEHGEAHEHSVLESEAGFRARGSAEAQRARFLEREQQRTAEADSVDRRLERKKRDAKREKARKREREWAGEQHGDSGSEDGDAVGGVRLAARADEAEDVDAPLDRPRPKRAKKWFEDDEGVSWKNGRKVSKGERNGVMPLDQPETLEDLEALAQGLMG